MNEERTPTAEELARLETVLAEREVVAGQDPADLGLSPGTVERLTVKNNLHLDGYDRRLHGEVLEASAELRGLLEAGQQDWPAFQPLLADIWGTFYKADPELVQERNVAAEGRPNRPLVSRILEDPETEQVRATTMLCETAAALATLAAGGRLREELAKREELRQALQDQAQEPGEGGSEAPSDIEAHARELRRAVREAVQAGREEADRAAGVMRGWGLEPGDLQRVPLETRLEAVRRLSSPRLRHLADLVGRMRNLARRRQAERLRRQPDELHSITVGSDLARVLPAELGALTHPARRLDFLRRLQDGAVLQYELRSRPAEKQGPMIVAVDVSGSMEGEPLDWAIGVALALADTCARQKRHLALYFFTTEIEAEYRMAPGQRNLLELAEIASQGAGGGTAYEPALDLALAYLDLYPAFKAADLVFVTDGVCHLKADYLREFLQQKRAAGLRVWTVLIGTDDPGELRKWSDRIWQVKSSGMMDDAGAEAAGDIFEEVVSS